MKKDNLRWVEDTAHLRRVGYADEIADIRHTGWFTDDFQEETYRGVVFRLTKLRGYLVGYEDPNNDGAARLQFCDADSDTEAARMADPRRGVMLSPI